MTFGTSYLKSDKGTGPWQPGSRAETSHGEAGSYKVAHMSKDVETAAVGAGCPTDLECSQLSDTAMHTCFAGSQPPWQTAVKAHSQRNWARRREASDKLGSHWLCTQGPAWSNQSGATTHIRRQAACWLAKLSWGGSNK